MNTTTNTTHPLLAAPAPAPGMYRYVLTAAHADEIIATIWATADDKATAFAEIKAAIATWPAFDRGAVRAAEKALHDAIGRRSAKPARAPAPAPVMPKTVYTKAYAHGAWCRRCGGPCCDGSGYCGEC